MYHLMIVVVWILYSVVSNMRVHRLAQDCCQEPLEVLAKTFEGFIERNNKTLTIESTPLVS